MEVYFALQYTRRTRLVVWKLAHQMIRQNDLEAVLVRQHVKATGGQVVDHEILKQDGRVSRLRQYRVYLPKGYSENRQYPLIMLLHGCKQDHLSIQDISGFDAIADREGAIVVYPFVTTYSGMRNSNCWGWWLTRQRQRGRGEVSDLHRIAEDVSELYAVDETRRHICGLSSGAAMSVVSLASYSDFWTSGASIAGVPYGESSRSVKFVRQLPVVRKTVGTLVRLLKRELVAPAPPLLVIQSKADKTVGPKLGSNLRDSWLVASGCEEEPDSLFGDSTPTPSWRFEQYSAEGALQVGHFLLSNVPHGWPGGLPGDYSVPDAPNVSELIWMFFKQSSASQSESPEDDSSGEQSRAA